MKPSILLRLFPLSICAAATLFSYAQAEAFFSQGVSKEQGWFDANKAYFPCLFYSYSTDKGLQPDIEAVSQYFSRQDDQLCWAATASNILTYMKNQAGMGVDYSSTHSLSTGNATVDSLVHGVSQYAIYETFSSSFENKAGYVDEAVAWYAKKTSADLQSNVLATSFQMYGSNYVGHYLPDDITSGSTTYSQVLRESLQNSPISLTVAQQFDDEWYPHAVTLWGFETDESGAVTLLYITDSDDASTTLRTINATENAEGILELSGGAIPWNFYNAQGEKLEIPVEKTIGNYDRYYMTGISSYQNFFLLVPEPSTTALSLLGLAALAMRRKRG